MSAASRKEFFRLHGWHICWDSCPHWRAEQSCLGEDEIEALSRGEVVECPGCRAPLQVLGDGPFEDRLRECLKPAVERDA